MFTSHLHDLLASGIHRVCFKTLHLTNVSIFFFSGKKIKRDRDFHKGDMRLCAEFVEGLKLALEGFRHKPSLVAASPLMEDQTQQLAVQMEEKLQAGDTDGAKKLFYFVAANVLGSKHGEEEARFDCLAWIYTADKEHRTRRWLYAVLCLAQHRAVVCRWD